MSVTEAPAKPPASTRAVLDFAWDAGKFRADDAIAATGLTRSTVLAALDSLIDIGLVEELPNGRQAPGARVEMALSTGSRGGSRLGRPARRFQLRAGAGVVIGVDAGWAHLTTIAADLSGHQLAREEVDVTEADRESPDRRRDLVLTAIDGVLAAAGRAVDEVVSVGLGVPAPVNGQGISPPHPLHFWEHMNPGLQATLDELFPAARVENDAALATLAEGAAGAARGYQNFVAVLVGRRLGAAVFLEGQIVRGAHGAVGELGGLSLVAGIGNTTGLGTRAEEWAATALAEGRIPADHPWAELGADEFTAENLLASARLDDPVTGPLLTELGLTLGRICSVLAHFYDPEAIVLCGAVTGALTEVLRIARWYAAQEAQVPAPAILVSQLGGDVVAIGGLSAARDAARQIVVPTLLARQQQEARASGE